MKKCYYCNNTTKRKYKNKYNKNMYICENHTEKIINQSETTKIINNVLSVYNHKYLDTRTNKKKEILSSCYVYSDGNKKNSKKFYIKEQINNLLNSVIKEEININEYKNINFNYDINIFEDSDDEYTDNNDSDYIDEGDEYIENEE